MKHVPLFVVSALCVAGALIPPHSYVSLFAAFSGGFCLASWLWICAMETRMQQLNDLTHAVEQELEQLHDMQMHFLYHYDDDPRRPPTVH